MANSISIRRKTQPSRSGSLPHLQLIASREDLEVQRGT
jgi:hypothetical protein